MSKELLAALRGRGLLEYGSVIKGEEVRDILGIEYPEVGTKKDFDEVALAELGAVDYVRNILLGEGKFIASHQGDYRILLPSENKRQVDAYMQQADRKLRRARKLSRATMANIRQNLFFSFVFNAAGVPIAAGVLYPWFGLLLSPIIAGAAMAFSSVAVIGNSLRLRSIHL